MILGTTGLDKADSGLNAHQGGFNWMNLVNLGLRLMLSTLSNTGNDKADTATSASPLQVRYRPHEMEKKIIAESPQRTTRNPGCFGVTATNINYYT